MRERRGHRRPAMARPGGLLRVAAAVAALLLGSGIGGVRAQEAEPPGPESSLAGRVVAEGDGEPIPGVEVILGRDSLRAMTDDDGEFAFDAVAPGEHVIRARHLGFRDRSASLVVASGALVEVTLTLSTEPVELREIVVVVRSPLLARAGFYERQDQGYSGEFIDRAEIERRNPDDVTDLFRNMRGLRVVYGGIYGSQVLVNQRVTFRDRGGCEPALWLDGVKSTMPTYDMMRVEEIEGIEVYTGGGAPGTFNDPCGTVVIWTRVPIHQK